MTKKIFLVNEATKFIYFGIRRQLLNVAAIFVRKKKPTFRSDQEIKKILLIQLNRIGDTVLSLPVIDALEKKFPAAEIDVVTSEYLTELFGLLAGIKNIYQFPESFYKLIFKIGQIRKFFSARKYDLCLDFTCEYWLASAFLAYLSKAALRIGYDVENRGIFFTHPLAISFKKNQHIVDIYGELLGPLGMKISERKTNFRLNDPLIPKMRRFLSYSGVGENSLLVVVHPGGYYPSQRWLPERFSQIIERLVESYQAKVFLIVGPREKEITALLRAQLGKKIYYFDNLSLRKLISLMCCANLFIGNNSGPLHLAVSLDIPTVSMMGPTVPQLWWPLGEKNLVLRKELNCSPCLLGWCSRHSCMRQISIEEVWEAVEKQVSLIG